MWIKSKNTLINADRMDKLVITKAENNCILQAVRLYPSNCIELARSPSAEHIEMQMANIAKALNSGANLCRVYDDEEKCNRKELSDCEKKQ
ncbi:MAG: hypothetical protein NC078_01710 [Ruminococcus sp.]|nr:hypothetical protein [Ruminococcus sp.]